MLRLGVLISGRGSNLQALIDAMKLPGFPACVAVVISNKADAQGLERAKEAGIATEVLSHRDFSNRDLYDRALDALLKQHAVELVCMAGFMRLLTPWLVEEWRDRLINIHPSLLPSFKGLEAQQQALDAGVAVSGCTVHFVRAEMDARPIIVQAAVSVHASDTVESLSRRILEMEHVCYPLAVRLIAEGKVCVKGEKVLVEGSVLAPGVVLVR